MTELSGMKRLDQRPIPSSQNEIRAMMAVRNEIIRLPAVLRHHRQLGIDRFFIADNQSTDGTVEFLAAQPDVHVFSAEGSFAESRYGLTWLNEALDLFGAGHWCLVIDADENFIYPSYETIKLPAFCQFLDRVGEQAVFSVVLDMYANKALNDVRLDEGEALLDTCRYFDGPPYRLFQVRDFPHMQVYGGVRDRVFHDWEDRGYHSPTMSTVPLVKWQRGMEYTLGRHALTPVTLSKVYGAILHFKFLSDFADRADIEAARGEHFAGAREYRVYQEYLAQNRSPNFFGKESVKFENSRQLVSMGLMRTSPEYEAFIASAAG